MTTGVKVSVRLPPKLAEEIDSLVKEGLFSNRSDLIKEAIRYYIRELRKELTDEERWRLKAVEDVLKEDWESEEDSFWDSY
ncbi:ribbon-helix-helix domain-containing protein [Palaeococcus ferrophilus]|uniref:ribbon-helix-helix domain-containing protein n=1 Tax=Palaeococcus ferrophilus TaxID=83868 RepID=UPI00064F7F22|nr:ribbon-helix-helix domain-containing protein [Palaeococcus ferrophilus]